MTGRPTTITVADDGSARADLAWRWLTAQVWPGWRVDVVRTAAARGPGRIAPSRCGLARLRSVDSPLAPSAALLGHAGTGLYVVGGGASDGEVRGPRSLALSLIADGRVPVVVAARADPVRSVLVVADPSPQAEAAVRVLRELPLAGRAVATVVAVADASGAAPERADALRALLVDVGLRAGTRLLEPDPTVAGSRAATVLQSEIDRHAPDLVVVGGPATGLLAGRVRSSLPIELVRSTGRTVLVGPRRVA